MILLERNSLAPGNTTSLPMNREEVGIQARTEAVSEELEGSFPGKIILLER